MSGERIDSDEVKKVLAPGIWVDTKDCTHIDVPDVLKHLGVPVTEENRKLAIAMAKNVLRLKNPDMKIRYRRNKEDEGVEL